MMKATLPNKMIAAVLTICMCPGCMTLGSRQDQFGYAAMKGDVVAARQFHDPGFARMRITETNGQKSVPVQYAIIQNNKAMATFLVKNGGHTSINGQNLTYYCAANGNDNMARHFASLGIGSMSDISRAKANKARARQSSGAGALIALGVLAALMSNGSASQSESFHDSTTGRGYLISNSPAYGTN